jgi:hypothetical protein
VLNKKRVLAGAAVCVLGAFFIRCNIQTSFGLHEPYIPTQAIKKELNTLKNIRLIQFLNWPMIATKLKQDFPMIESVSLSFLKFPTVIVSIKEKQPWIIVINNNRPHIFSYDGTLLNHHLNDIELPNRDILVVKSEFKMTENHQMLPSYLKLMQAIDDGLNRLPLFKMQQIILKKDTIEIVEENGLIIHFGNQNNLYHKFTMLNYFIGSTRGQFKQGQRIDIQFPNRVIIK